MKKKAYRVSWKGSEGIVAATSAGQARARMMGSGRDAGYKPRFIDIKATRAKQYDGWADQDQSQACWSEEHLQPSEKEKAG